LQDCCQAIRHYILQILFKAFDVYLISHEMIQVAVSLQWELIAGEFCCQLTKPVIRYALVASPAVDHMQVGSSDVQTSEHVHSGLPTPPNRRTCLQLNFTLSCHPAAGPTVHENRLLWVYFAVFSTVCLELAATNSSH